MSAFLQVSGLLFWGNILFFGGWAASIIWADRRARKRAVEDVTRPARLKVLR